MIPTYNGQSIPILSLRPDWAQAVSLSLSYKTTISEALDTSEERQCRQARPLYGLGYTTTGLSAEETAYLRTIIETADNLPVGCPLWPLGAMLTVDAGAGALSLSTDPTADCLFDVFYQFALLWQDFDRFEVLELSAVESAGFTLSAAIAGSYTTDAIVLPLAYGMIPRGEITQLTDEHGRWDCQFSETFHGLHDQSIPEATP